MVGKSKQILDSGSHAGDSGFQALDSSLCQWNLDSGFQSFVGFGFLEVFSGFQSPGFQVLLVKFPELRIPRATISRFLGCGFPFMGQ